MRPALLLGPVLVAALGGCGSAQQAFDEGFDKSFHESCYSAAVDKGAPTALADQTCSCALRKINEQFDSAAKASLGDDKLRPIMNECVKSVVQDNG